MGSGEQWGLLSGVNQNLLLICPCYLPWGRAPLLIDPPILVIMMNLRSNHSEASHDSHRYFNFDLYFSSERLNHLDRSELSRIITQYRTRLVRNSTHRDLLSSFADFAMNGIDLLCWLNSKWKICSLLDQIWPRLCKCYWTIHGFSWISAWISHSSWVIWTFSSRGIIPGRLGQSLQISTPFPLTYSLLRPYYEKISSYCAILSEKGAF
jgi:hypothetical protein